MASLNQHTILSSSPPRTFATHILSSSPLPSPSEMFKTKPGIIRAGSDAASMPPSASASFTTVSALLRDAKITKKKPVTTDTNGGARLDVGESPKVVKSKAKKSVANKTDEEPKPPKAVKKLKVAAIPDESNSAVEVKNTKKKAPTKSAFFGEVDGDLPKAVVKKPRAKKVDKEITGESEIVTKKPRAKKAPAETTGESSEIVVKKPRTKKADKEPTEKSAEALPKKTRAKPADKDITGESKAKVVRKPRAKKPIDLSQGLFPESNVTKPASRAKKPKDDMIIVEEPFGLVEAVKRKTTWTPPALNTIEMSITPASALVLDEDVQPAGVGTSEGSKGFSDLFGSFGFLNAGSSARSSSGDSVATTTKAQNQAIIRKRKLIELVTASNDGSTSPTKKAPKKKPRTITERATAAYAEEDDSLMEPTPFMQYFSLQSKDKGPSDGLKVPGKLRSKSPTKGTKQAPILLSPESAMKQVSDQDFVFGTSSQLARENSPTLLRDLHQAMQASLEQDDPYDFLDDPFLSPDTKKRNLWDAASRGANGELLDVEMAEVTDVIAQLNTTINPIATEEVDDWLDIDEVVQPEKLVRPEQVVVPNLSKTNQEILPSSPSLPKSHKSPAPRPSRAKVASPVKAAKVVSSQEEMPQMPSYSSYSTHLLAKEIASYRFKPIKSRDGMILMLERCWEGKHRVALQSLDTNLPKTLSIKSSKPPASIQASPKRPQGRPKKDSSAATLPVAKPKLGRPKKDSSAVTSPAAKTKPGRPKKTDTVPVSTLNTEKPQTPKKPRKTKQPVEDISDSDSPLSPSPPRRRLSQVGKSPSPLELTTEDLASSPERTSSQTQALLFEHITKAITIGPPSKESNNPTWHEKILLYDPIILEDLAVWLNTGALGKVGWDGEVAPAEVKKWCESKSICCLWKANLRGGARSRY